jgi:hypothetical protein
MASLCFKHNHACVTRSRSFKAGPSWSAGAWKSPADRAVVHIYNDCCVHSSTAILSEKYRISSELRSQATAGPVSTTVGDHVGIRGAVGSLFWLRVAFRPTVLRTHGSPLSLSKRLSFFACGVLCSQVCHYCILSCAPFCLRACGVFWTVVEAQRGHAFGNGWHFAEILLNASCFNLSSSTI